MPEPLGDQRRALGDRRRLEQHRDRELDPVGLLDHHEQPHGDQRVAAEIEEAVLDADLADAEQLLPEAGQHPLDVVARLDVGAVELGALELPGRPSAAAAALSAAWAISASRSSEETTTCGSPSASARPKASAPSAGRMPCDRLCASRSSAGDSGWLAPALRRRTRPRAAVGGRIGPKPAVVEPADREALDLDEDRARRRRRA